MESNDQDGQTSRIVTDSAGEQMTALGGLGLGGGGIEQKEKRTHEHRQ